MMTDVTIIRERPEITNGWVLRATTTRFGKNEVMCEGSYDDCIRYWKRQFKNPSVDKITDYINGYHERYGVYTDDTMTLHRNGFEEHASGIY